MREIALETLKRLYRKDCPDCFFIIDDTQTIKRAKKMQAVGKRHHHATGQDGQGHTILKVCLYYRGVTIPWGRWLYIKKEHRQELDLPFRKLTALAAEAIRIAALPEKLRITVLFDAFYLCLNVVQACQQRQWYYIGVGKKNRCFRVQAGRRKLETYGRNVLKNSGNRYRAVVRHLHLVDCVDACLTPVGIQRHAQGHHKTKHVLSLEPISPRQRQRRQIVWQEEIKNVIKVSHDKNVIRRLEKLLAA